MDTTTAAKKKKLLVCKSNEVSAAEEDRISDLPSEIVHHIFSFLPLKYLVRTCALSKRWKHLWCTYPCCITGGLSPSDLRTTSWDENDMIITRPPLDSSFKSLGFLSFSRGYFGNPPLFPALKELEFEHLCGLKYLRIQMPELRDISIRRCDNIQELCICGAKLKKISLVSSYHARCPVRTRVKIDAPLLEIITWFPCDVTDEWVIGRFDSLREASVGLSLLHFDFSDSKMRSLSTFLTGISRCHSLTLDGKFVEILSRLNHLGGGVQLSVFDRLKSLKVTDLSRRNTCGLASLFRSSPACSSIEISMMEQRQEDPWEFSCCFVEGICDWESQAQSAEDSFLGHLKFVEISRLTQTEVDLVKFLLKHGKALQQLSMSKLGGEEMIRTQIMGFPRASSNVQVIFQ